MENNDFILSKRLATCLEYAKAFNHLADIGTDHAKVPIHAIQTNIVLDAIAIDNKKGPYNVAIRNVLRYHLKDRIDVVLADGLNGIKEKTDVAIISGMGGHAIHTILKNGPLHNIKRLILQPNNDTLSVRKTIENIGFYIIDELIIQENNLLYDIIVADIGEISYTDNELRFGPIHLQRKGTLYKKRLLNEIKHYEKLLKNVPAKRQKEIQAEIDIRDEVL